MWGTTQSLSSLKEGIFSELRRLGATRMEAYYSGGNDEGGVDDITVFRPAGRSDYLLHVVRPNWKGEEVMDSHPSFGPFSTKKDALTAAKALVSDRAPKLEAVKFEGEFVPLLQADTGNWEEEGKLDRLVNDVLSMDFGTWAGDFSASGVVFATLEDEHLWREGETSTYVSDPSAGEY